MKTINSCDLELIGGGGNNLVYRPIAGRTDCEGYVVRVPKCNAQKSCAIIDIWRKLQNINIPTLSFVDPCLVDGKEAILCEDLFTHGKIYVSPNSVETDEDKQCREISEALFSSKHKIHINNYQEQALYKQKIAGICNVEDCLNNVKLDLKQAATNKIFLDFDCYFFGFVPTEDEVNLDYKIADFDNIHMEVDDSELYEKMCELFTETFMKFIQFFVDENKQEDLVTVIESFNWK